jgi:hypothetical protein
MSRVLSGVLGERSESTMSGRTPPIRGLAGLLAFGGMVAGVKKGRQYKNGAEPPGKKPKLR